MCADKDIDCRSKYCIAAQQQFFTQQRTHPAVLVLDVRCPYFRGRIYYASCLFEAIEAIRKGNGQALKVCLWTASGGRDQLGRNLMISFSMWSRRFRTPGVGGPALDHNYCCGWMWVVVTSLRVRDQHSALIQSL